MLSLMIFFLLKIYKYKCRLEVVSNAGQCVLFPGPLEYLKIQFLQIESASWLEPNEGKKGCEMQQTHDCKTPQPPRGILKGTYDSEHKLGG